MLHFRIQSFWSLDRNLDSRSLKNVYYFWFVSIFELIFLSNYEPASSNQNLLRKLSICGGRFGLKTFWFDPCIGFMTVSISQKVLFVLILLDIQTFSSQTSPLRSPQSKRQSKAKQLYISTWNFFCFSRLRQCPASPKIPKENNLILAFVNFQTHISPKLQALYLRTGSASKTF